MKEAHKINKLFRSYRWPVILLLVSTVLLLAMSITNHVSSSLTDEQYYKLQLSSLSRSVDQIDHMIKHHDDENNIDKDSLQESTTQYKEALISGIGLCRILDARHQLINSDPNKKNLSDQTNKVHQFCTDFERVLEYALKASKKTEVFILFPVDQLDNNSLTANMSPYLQMIQSTRSGLYELKSEPFQDPGLQEQITVIEDLEKQAKVAQREFSSAANNKLRSNVEKHQLDFLNARAYFWKNTVEINNIKRGLQQLHNLF